MSLDGSSPVARRGRVESPYDWGTAADQDVVTLAAEAYLYGFQPRTQAGWAAEQVRLDQQRHRVHDGAAGSACRPVASARGRHGGARLPVSVHRRLDQQLRLRRPPRRRHHRRRLPARATRLVRRAARGRHGDPRADHDRHRCRPLGLLGRERPARPRMVRLGRPARIRCRTGEPAPRDAGPGRSP
jgi:hypothetical protein